MNLQTRIDERLWDAIRNSFENRNYTGAIQDSMYFLSDLIRERSGLEGDGVALVGQAFGGRSPLLKVSKLKTESEKNVQKGVEQLLRGLYQAVRNPRSHGKHLDTEEDAVAMILFINYLVKIIDKSKTPFLEHVFISRVLDPDFVPKKRYAQLLVGQIPEKKRMEIFYGVFQRLSEGDGNKLKYFFDALFDVISPEEKQEIYLEVSDLLKHADEIEIIRSVIQAFPEIWPELEESARLRIENKLIDSIKDGKWDPKMDQCRSGAFGTWATNITEDFSLKDDLLYVLTNKLASSDRGEQDYVFHFFSGTFGELAESPTPRLKRIIINGLKAGDARFKNMVENSFNWLGEKWSDPFKEALESFEEKPLPYDPDYDDHDIPF
jgi:uncharacterized protein (TIGR02391 family)